MKEKGAKIFRFVLILSVVLIAGFIVFRFEGVPASWAPSVQIQGSTPFEKVSSMVEYLNAQSKNDFVKVYYQGYEGKTRVWRYNVAVDPELFQEPRTLREQQKQQVRLERYFSVIGDLFVNTATWDETAGGIVVTVISPVSLGGSVYGFIFSTDEVGAGNIRKFPKNWPNFVLRELFKAGS